jgi:pyridoxal phosphate enzyme (YggS family)
MSVDNKAYQNLRKQLDPRNVKLVAVSKTKPVEDIMELYNLGHRDFGENYTREMVEKYSVLPSDIRWHFIGHLQTNKVKQIASFVQLIHGVDSLKLLEEINKQAKKNERVLECLLQVHIASEETKFGLDEKELQQLISDKEKLNELNNIRIVGLMGIASFTEDLKKIKNEFRKLKELFDSHSAYQAPNLKFKILSMGMSADYKLAIGEGSNMVRIGSMLFGEREQ